MINNINIINNDIQTTINNVKIDYYKKYLQDIFNKLKNIENDTPTTKKAKKRFAKLLKWTTYNNNIIDNTTIFTISQKMTIQALKTILKSSSDPMIQKIIDNLVIDIKKRYNINNECISDSSDILNNVFLIIQQALNHYNIITLQNHYKIIDNDIIKNQLKLYNNNDKSITQQLNKYNDMTLLYIVDFNIYDTDNTIIKNVNSNNDFLTLKELLYNYINNYIYKQKKLTLKTTFIEDIDESKTYYNIDNEYNIQDYYNLVFFKCIINNLNLTPIQQKVFIARYKGYGLSGEKNKNQFSNKNASDILQYLGLKTRQAYYKHTQAIINKISNIDINNLKDFENINTDTKKYIIDKILLIQDKIKNK